MQIVRKLRATALACLLLAPPALAGELQWEGRGDEENAELALREAGTDHKPLSFWCTPYVDIVYVAWFFRPANASEGMQTDFRLSAGGIDLPVGAIGYGIENDGSFVLEGQIPFDQRFIDFISASGTLTAEAEGKAETYTLAGAKEQAAKLLALCGSDK